MLIIPAIDILDKQCVRLFQGDYAQSRIYARDPVAVAEKFFQAGAKLIHLVDLDAARNPDHHNRDVIRAIRKSVPCALEVGGGIRTAEDVEGLLKIGIQRLVLGTILVKEPDRVRSWGEQFRMRFIAGIDAAAGRVRVAGWTKEEPLADLELVDALRELPISEIIYTSIGQDGTLSGPDLARTNAVAGRGELPVILSGGISSERDLDCVCLGRHERVRGIIIGKALYENRIDLAGIINRYSGPEF